ncbi:MAG TPA: hypothetical protein VMS56_10340 [Thermoanaerobaculia bacterium]|nr:hypothetical protein [Thermoanaerobaculia bacterium]
MNQTAGFLIPVAAITMMLWLLWSESLRPRPMPRQWYVFRAVIYLGIAATMLYNGWRYAWAFSTWNFVFIGTAVAVAVAGAAFFLRKAFPRKGTEG